MASDNSPNGSNARFLAFVLLVIVASVLDFIGSLSYYFNFEGKNIFMPYYSDRNILPFPLLFPEFDLSSYPNGSFNDGANNTHNISTDNSSNRVITSKNSNRSRGADEMCYRRILQEYEQYRLNDANIFENVPKKGFIVPKDSPPGWLTYTSIDKLVLNLLDAYRFDYVVYDPLLANNKKDLRNIFRNRMDSFYSLFKTPGSSSHQPRDEHRSRLHKLISSYPTLTVFAVKSIMSGDKRNVGMVAGNLNPTDLKLDHLPHQCSSNNLELNLLGDVTSYDLAPNCFKNHMTNKHKNTVNDIYNADQMIYDNFKTYIDTSDCLILHLVGADHLSHCGGRNTNEMSNIMDNYNKFVKELLAEYKKRKNYMILFFGDHGQKESGSHGDDSVEEMETFLLAHSDLKLRDFKDDRCPISDTPAGYRLNHSVLNGQVEAGFTYGHQYTQDICTTSSLLLNIPIPFHSEGFIIPTAVPVVTGPDGRDLTEKFLVQLHHVNVHHLLRIVDLLSQNPEVTLNERKHEAILAKRLKLANMYTILRLVDTASSSGMQGGGGQVFSQEGVEKLYKEYSSLCKRLSVMTSELVNESTRSFTFHYLYVCIIIKYVAIVMLLYCMVGTLRYYQFPRSAVVTEGKVTRAKSKGLEAEWQGEGAGVEGELKGPGRDALVRKALLRLLRAVLGSLLLSVTLGTRFKLLVPEDVPLLGSLLGQRVSRSLTLRWPLGVFRTLLSLAQQYTLLLSRFFVIEEYDIYLHFSLLYGSFLTLFLLCDLPFLARSYRELLGCKASKSIEYCSSALATFYYNVGRYSVRKLTTVFYCIVFYLVVVSECATYSHDTISRHLLALFMIIEAGPFLLRGGYLAKTVRNRLLLVLGLLKFSSFFHDYRLFFYSSELPSASWLLREKVLSLFEVSLLSLTAFYVVLLRVLQRFHKMPLEDCRNNFELSLVCCVRVFKRRGAMLAVYTATFFCVLVNYALTTQSSLVGVHRFIHNLHNAYNMKMFVASLFAWAALVLFVLSLLGMLLNPFDLFFNTGKGRGSRGGSADADGSANSAATSTYRVSSFLLYLMPQVCFLIFLVCGQKKAFQILVGLAMLYHTCFILTCKNSNFYLSHALLLQTAADVVYFASGSLDKLLNLNFQTGFIFVTNYYSPISDPTVVFDTMSLHMLFAMVLMFSYFNTASLRYDLHGTTGLNKSFDFDSSDRFRSYVESVDAQFSLGASPAYDHLGSASRPNAISRKTFTLRKIIHVITL
ncbi:conserved hypothetical protein [Theileria orientalis strain Shintoku]|uniref:Integral membrane protein n=1 Tax=Theileria orientalis strain Shintoku TaxID=869250 RepID=J7M8B0_THEOR|nr:conserved hypothetical protein [Theileria orientalis strain Shintoku]BAM38688.1 conserved hypothetical protein [Theileria orientalis strain Shintoku]|eukprot:XP_009688989.1 conserved hypothetical protein [Theileria orientalis strain Shintoku]